MRELPGSQQSDQWIKNRCGRITASRICDVMSYTNDPEEFVGRFYEKREKCSECGQAFLSHLWLVSLSGDKVRKKVCSPACERAYRIRRPRTEAAARRNYKLELVAERLTGRSADHYVSPYMEHGTETEDEARSFYELATKTMVEPVGFVLHPTLDFAGASPDGLVGEDGSLEIKCPKTETLLQWMDSKEIPDEYLFQMQWELACTGRAWCDFYGYDPRLPAGMRHVYERVPRNDALIEQIEAEVIKFDAEVEAFIAARGLPPTQWMVAVPPMDAEPVYHEAGDAYLNSLAEGIGLDELVP